MCTFAAEMDIFANTPIQLILFFILYGVTGAMPLLAALYLLLRRGNAFAPGVTPPARLRRWAASFFALSALDHVLWLLFYLHLRSFHSTSDMADSAIYVAIVVFDCVTLLTTLAGTLLSMLQDRRRRIWPVFVAMIPFVVLGAVQMVRPSGTITLIAPVYILLLYVLFTVYMVFAVRRYGRWLNDNYADLENKKVWLSQMVTLSCLLLFFLYTFVDTDSAWLLFSLHFIEIVLFALLLWRVETLQQLENSIENSNLTTPAPRPLERVRGGENPITIDLDQIEQLLKEHCVNTQLYLQHDLTLQKLAQTIGTNRYYLSQYFSRQGITYNIYINNLRINHFISCYQEAVKAEQPIIAQKLASDSGYRSYSTFSLAFKQRTGQSLTAWIRGLGGVIY